MSNIKLPIPRDFTKKTAKTSAFAVLMLSLLMLYALSMTFQYIMFSVILAQE